ncbi:hypothetical protein [Dyella flagellata]|uniref:EcxA zinc-binding domain-containing protein n=1 Tax=Dyella flagellata TaxID=1867833 RepID=A0ABQ5XF47_9GAMM|nr:hypothetical protein [Dyella flagellata]GLQ89059.1 hypothetical protein GCM10007898_26310 [Dyella flagellata]
MKTPDRSLEGAERKTGTAASHFAAKAFVPPWGADNRPRDIAQRRLQQAADDSPQVRQLQALQRTADGSVVQMKPFSASMLNVAGEDHNESKLRRVREAYVTQWVTDGGYWTEPDFQVNVNGQEVDADPKILRFLRNMHVLRSLWNTLVTTKLPPSYIPEHAQRIWRSTSPVIDLVESEYAGSVGDRYSGGAALSAEGGQLRDQINHRRHAYFDLARQALQELNNLHPYQPADRERVKTLLAQFQASAANMVKNVMEGPNLDFLRSKAMHEAAIAKSASIGVWKIGQSHVNNIKRHMEDNPAAYNLMTKTEFNDEYDRLDYYEVPDY